MTLRKIFNTSPIKTNGMLAGIENKGEAPGPNERSYLDFLLSLTKWVFGGFSAVVIVGATLTVLDRNSLKNSYDAKLTAVSARIDSIDSAAKAELSLIKETAGLELKLIKAQAQLDALKTIKTTIDEELSGPGIQHLISEELNLNVKDNLDELAEKSFAKASDKLSDYAEETSKLVISYQSATLWNSMEDIREIDSIAVFNSDKRLRDFAKGLRESAAQFHLVYVYENEKRLRPSLQFRVEHPAAKNMSDVELEKYIISEIVKRSRDVDPLYIVECFLVISELLYSDLQVFEFKKLEKLTAY
jgi:hypothetical protein